jgi:hypothetical protein
VKESEKTYLPQTKMVRTSLFATPTQKLVESTSHTIEPQVDYYLSGILLYFFTSIVLQYCHFIGVESLPSTSYASESEIHREYSMLIHF